MTIEELPEYQKDLKRLQKTYRTLPSDIEDVKKVLKVRPDASPPFSVRIAGLGLTTCVIKVRKIASDSFKGRGRNSGFRLVYAHFPDAQKVVMVELYHKSDKENEDRERIFGNFK